MSLKDRLNSISKCSILISIIMHIIRFLNPLFRKENPLISVSNQWHLKISLRISRIIPKIISQHLDTYFFNRNIFFLINNLPFSVGHCYGEVDYASRFIIENQTAKLIYLAPKFPLLAYISSLVREDVASRIYFLLNGTLCIIIYPIIFSFRKSLLDLSLGQYDIINNNTISFGDFWNIKYRRHVEMINRTGPSTLSLPVNKKTSLAKDNLYAELAIEKKYVVIQIKDSVVNATFAPNDPTTLLPALKWLISEGYDLVQGGRESTPTCFKKLGVKPYSSMDIASPAHDAILYSGCTMAISSGSGVNNIPSKFGKPQLILNVWNFGYVAEKTNLVWPTRLVRSVSNQIISLREQFDIIKNWDPYKSKDVYSEFYALDANSVDIKNSLIELITFCKKGNWIKNKLRNKFYSKYKKEVFAVQESQIAIKFIEKYYRNNIK